MFAFRKFTPLDKIRTMTKRLTFHSLALWLIMLTAAFLRIRLFLQIEHNIDHAYPVWQALMTLDRGVFPLIGQQTSVLFANPPLTGYLFLPLVALIRLPIAPYLLTIPMNTLGVLLGYRSMRILIGRNGALIGAALMAVNPWLIEYSRTSWVQSLLPFLVPALMWALTPVLLGTAKKPARRLILAAVILTITANTYLLAYALVIPVVLLLVIFRKRIQGRALLVGAAIFAAGAAVYGYGLLTQVDQVAARAETFASQPARLSDEAWSHAVRLITGADYELARGTDAPIRDSDLRHTLSQISHWVLYAALVIGIVIAAYRVIRRRDPRMIILLIWFFTPVLLMSYVGQVIHPFYQLLGIPAGYALVGVALTPFGRAVARPYTHAASPTQAIERGSKALVFLPSQPYGWRRAGVAWLQRIASIVVIFFLTLHGAIMAINSARYYEETAYFPGRHELTALPLDGGLRLGAAIRENLPPGGTVINDLDAPYILSSFSGMALDYLPRASADIFPANGGLSVTWIGQTLLSAPTIVIVQLPGWQQVMVHPLPNASTFIDASRERIPSDQGIAFVGEEIDDRYLRLHWLITDRVPGIDGRTFGAFMHIFDSTGERVAVVSGDVIPGYWWRVGDVHRYWLELPVGLEGTPPYRIGVGMYDPNANLNAIFVTPEGEYTPIIMLPFEWTPP